MRPVVTRKYQKTDGPIVALRNGPSRDYKMPVWRQPYASLTSAWRHDGRHMKPWSMDVVDVDKDLIGRAREAVGEFFIFISHKIVAIVDLVKGHSEKQGGLP